MSRTDIKIKIKNSADQFESCKTLIRFGSYCRFGLLGCTNCSYSYSKVLVFIKIVAFGA
jgi:hypothetical protein